jgi:hypothetical protein
MSRNGQAAHQLDIERDDCQHNRTVRFSAGQVAGQKLAGVRGPWADREAA